MIPVDDRVRQGVETASLHVRIYPAEDASVKATILFFHGNGEVVADYDSSYPMFARAGAKLIVSDYRGYGRSTGTPTLRSTIDDAAKVLTAVREDTNLDANKPLVVMGRSLGAACAIDLYSRAAEGVTAFILESGASDLVALVARRGMRLGAPLDDEARAKFDPLVKLPLGRAPLLIMHGEEDEMISPREARTSFESAGTDPADKHLVLIPGHGHNNVSLASRYWSALSDFLSGLSG